MGLIKIKRVLTAKKICSNLVKEPAKNETHIYSRKKYALIPIAEGAKGPKIVFLRTAVNAFTAFASPEVGVNGKKTHFFSRAIF